MSNYTPITGELRELLADINWTEILDHVHTNGGGICDGDWLDHWHEQAERLCDAIDAVHAQLEEENERLHREMDERLIAVGADAAKTIARLERENAALKAEYEKAVRELNDYAQDSVLLPKDADGVSWHIGDYDEHNREVTCIRDAGHGWEIVVDGLYTCEPTSLRHHKPDTWERIIEDARMCTGSREDYTAVPSMRWTNETDALVARCKALAGDAE